MPSPVEHFFSLKKLFHISSGKNAWCVWARSSYSFPTFAILLLSLLNTASVSEFYQQGSLCQSSFLFWLKIFFFGGWIWGIDSLQELPVCDPVFPLLKEKSSASEKRRKGKNLSQQFPTPLCVFYQSLVSSVCSNTNVFWSNTISQSTALEVMLVESITGYLDTSQCTNPSEYSKLSMYGHWVEQTRITFENLVCLVWLFGLALSDCLPNKKQLHKRFTVACMMQFSHPLVLSTFLPSPEKVVASHVIFSAKWSQIPMLKIASLDCLLQLNVSLLYICLVPLTLSLQSAGVIILRRASLG